MKVIIFAALAVFAKSAFANSSPQALLGVWESQMIVMGVSLQTDRWHFTDGQAEFESQVRSLADAEEMDLLNQAKYRVEHQGFQNGKLLIGLELISHVVKPGTDSMVKSLNNMRYCGLSNWIKGQHVEVKETSCGWLGIWYTQIQIDLGSPETMEVASCSNNEKNGRHPDLRCGEFIGLKYFKKSDSLFFNFGQQSEDLKTCQKYKEWSEELQCQKSDYFLRFGFHYCVQFVEKANRFTKRGQETLSKIRECLINKMEQRREILTCENAEDFALRDHEDCYIQSGFCKMDLTDKFQIYRIIHKELKNQKMKSTINRVLKQC